MDISQKNNKSEILKMNMKVLRLASIQPLKNESPMVFYLRFTLAWLSYKILIAGSIGHLVFNVYYGKTLEVADLSQDLFTIGIGVVINYIIIVLFAQKKRLADIVNQLGDFSQFGKPHNADKVNTRMDFFVKVHAIYTCVGIFVYTSMRIITAGTCEATKERHDNLNVCGLITNTWLNFHMDHFPVKQIMLVCQIEGAVAYLSIGSVSGNIVLVTVEHLVCRIDHLILNLGDIFKAKLDNDRRAKLNWCIRYHIYIIDLTKQIDICYAPMMYVHVTLTAIIIACVAFTFLLTFELQYLLFLIGCSIAIFMLCFAGQRLKDKSEEITQAIYNIEWYLGTPSMQRDIALMLIRSQRDLCLTVGGFGVMSYETFKTICKSVYSYLTLISTQLQK